MRVVKRKDSEAFALASGGSLTTSVIATLFIYFITERKSERKRRKERGRERESSKKKSLPQVFARLLQLVNTAKGKPTFDDIGDDRIDYCN